MIDRYELWHSTAALLLILLLRHDPRSARFLGRRGIALLLTGALLPLLDYTPALLLAQDSIAFLSRPRWMHSLLYGALWTAGGSLLVSFTAGPRWAMRVTPLVAAGFGLHLLLDWAAGSRVWLGFPGGAEFTAWQPFAKGHGLLIALLVAGHAAAEALPRHRRWVRRIVPAVLAVYLIGGTVQYLAVQYRARGQAQGHGTPAVEPANAWRTRWLAISDTGSGYRVSELSAFGARLAPSISVAAWNDQPRLLSLLADPAVRRFYFQVFRHPVARIEESPARLSLILQEAGDQVRSEPGRTFTYETTPDGEETVYRVARFD